MEQTIYMPESRTRRRKTRAPVEQNILPDAQAWVRPVQLVERYDSIDVARGIAIFLMILSHGVVGLVPLESLPRFGLEIVHLITKFSSTLFITVFGLSLSLFYSPHVHAADWSRRRNNLIFKGLEILVWYKVLTFIQMFQTFDRQAILEALLFIRFPDFVEVLGFYGFFLLWFPFFMPAWEKAKLPLQVAVMVAMAVIGAYFNQTLAGEGWASIKAILFEEKGYFTFGQFQRGSLVLLGMIVGRTLISQSYPYARMILTGMGIACFALFYSLTSQNMSGALRDIASNIGKHPPTIEFMSFSLGGALLLLSACLGIRAKVPYLLKGLAALGRNSLQSFIFHIFVIFVLYRYLLDLRHQVPYTTALSLTLLLIGITILWVQGLEFKRRINRSKATIQGGSL